MNQYQLAAQKLNSYMKLPLLGKEMLSHRIISQALEAHKKPLVSSSFGKDSTVLLHLVKQHTSNFDVVFNDTGVELKETLDFKDLLTQEWNLQLHIVKPKFSFWELVAKHGYPKESRNSKTGDRREPACCRWLKEKPMAEFVKTHDFDLNFVGLLGDEGKQRRWAYINHGCAIYAHKSWNITRCIPLIFWTQKDVWQYIKKNNLPINPAYAKFKIGRTGCAPCTGHLNWKKSIAKTNPKLLAHIIRDRDNETQLFSINTK